tara:strand:- start:136 stop:480 length:345 start_codon:yes stop_codon:yes gene_type:complete
MDENKNMQLFMGLCTSLVSQAWMQLGKIKNPMTDEINIDLDGASLTIDMLVMLKDKTKGNISEDESKIIDQSISELKMNYVMSKEKEENPKENKEEKVEEKVEEKSEKEDEKEK